MVRHLHLRSGSRGEPLPVVLDEKALEPLDHPRTGVGQRARTDVGQLVVASLCRVRSVRRERLVVGEEAVLDEDQEIGRELE
jgi:hypothetical protein